MARKLKNNKLDTRSARLDLSPSKTPYRTRLAQGLFLLYYRGKKSGSWSVYFILDDKRREMKIGQADDTVDANGIDILTFDQAQDAARNTHAHILTDHNKTDDERESEEPKNEFTVADAIELYLDDRSHLKSIKDIERRLRANVSPTLGHIKLEALKEKQIKDWHKQLAETPAKARPKLDGTQNVRERQNPRARKVSANRILSFFKAALNLACEKKKVSSNKAWLHVKPFKQVEQPKVEYFTNSECKRLLNACEPDFRDLVRAALLTGCRHSELVALRVKDYDPDNGTVLIAKSKSGKSRHVPLNQSGQELFERLAMDKKPPDRLLTRADGQSWESGHQSRRMQQACKRANIEPFKGFHVLRHSYASELVSRGVPLQYVSELLGHSDTQITAKHYAHLQPSALKDAVRQFLPDYGKPEKDNVVQLKK